MALRELTLRFEKRDVSSFELPAHVWHAEADKCDPAVTRALEQAAARIRAFHDREKYASLAFEEGGVRLELRVLPLSRVCLYVPGGTARYPSTVLMTAIPAKAAGVREICMTTPTAAPETLAAARVAGVDRVFVLGGAQAVAAFAYGTQTVPRVDKIVGPGNAYVTAAKRMVFGDVGIDSIAGPTEVVIAADDSANPAWVAADLLAQAEHDVLAAPILVAVGRGVAEAVAAQVDAQLATLPRKAIAEKAVADHGVAIVVNSVDEAIEIVNGLAPEHAGLAVRNARALAQRVHCAGAVFIGEHSPEPAGDYFAGPSHVLPTGGAARFQSPLSVADFVKRMSTIEYSPEALAAQSDAIIRLAEAEGLSAHARAISIRTVK